MFWEAQDDQISFKQNPIEEIEMKFTDLGSKSEMKVKNHPFSSDCQLRKDTTPSKMNHRKGNPGKHKRGY